MKIELGRCSVDQVQRKEIGPTSYARHAFFIYAVSDQLHKMLILFGCTHQGCLNGPTLTF